jgi:116 kDa U5 small nuclear ribonucleoprotein component
MASFEDYDEFGNYIGEDIDSDEDTRDDTGAAHVPLQQPLEGYEDEPMTTDPGMALMEIDGEFCSW